MGGASEELEGLDDTPEISAGDDYPLDSVMVRSETRTVAEVVKRIKQERYILNPDFQRAFVWKDDKQSKLIESCVMRIPLPVLYVAEGRDGRIIVVDGQQRLNTFVRFLENKLVLQGLGENHPLNGHRFRGLPINIQERIEDTQLTLYILDKDAPDRAKLDIFERVNSGVPLTRQQMRNAIYGGAATRWLADAANDDAFIKVTGGSLRSETMRDREALNRFCAFRLIGWQHYPAGDMDKFCGDALTRMNAMSRSELAQLRRSLNGSLKLNYRLFGRHAFRKSLAVRRRHAARSVLNIALFDVCSVLLTNIDDEVAAKAGEEIASKIAALLLEPDFHNCISYSTNSAYQVRVRFKKGEVALQEFFS
jgi:hypothetical protein